MFWDRIAGVYDLFGNMYNGKVNREMCRMVSEEIKSSDVVLECACGTGMISKAIAPVCKSLTATDFSEGMLKRARKKCSKFPNITFQIADVMSLDYADESFDVVIAANVIHLLDQPYKAIAELDRVCKTGGRLIIPTYVNREKTGKTGGVVKVIGKAGADFKQQFTFANYRVFFEKAGYRNIDTKLINGRVPCAVAIIMHI